MLWIRSIDQITMQFNSEVFGTTQGSHRPNMADCSDLLATQATQASLWLFPWQLYLLQQGSYMFCWDVKRIYKGLEQIRLIHSHDLKIERRIKVRIWDCVLFLSKEEAISCKSCDWQTQLLSRNRRCVRGRPDTCMTSLVFMLLVLGNHSDPQYLHKV